MMNLHCFSVRSRDHLANAAVFLSAIQPMVAGAQPAPNVINPGLQQQQDLRQQLQPSGTPAAPDSVIIKDEEKRDTQPIIENLPEGSFRINEVRIEGSRVVPRSELLENFAGLLGKSVQSAQVAKVVLDASNIYRRKGYFTSQLLTRPGSYANSVLTLYALEGFIEEVVPVGSGSPAHHDWVKRYMSRLVSTSENPKPITFAELERQLLLLQNVGGVRYSAQLVRGKAFAASRLVIALNPKALDFNIDLDNNLQSNLGDFQAVANLQFNALNHHPLQLNLFGQSAFPNANGLYSANLSWRTPVSDYGITFYGSMGYTETQTIAYSNGFSRFDFGGNSKLAYLGVNYPLLLARSAGLNISFQGGFQNSTNNANNLDTGSIFASSEDRLRVLRLIIDGYAGDVSATNRFALTLNQGLPIFGASNQSDSDFLANPTGNTSFTTAQIFVGRDQRIGNTNAYVNAKVYAQVSGDSVPTPEDFAYGGQFLGKAYRGTYLVGDQGVSGSLELGYNYLTNYRNSQISFIPYVAWDMGVAWNNNVSNGSSSSAPFARAQAASAALGLKGYVNDFSYDVGWGIPIDNTVNSSAIGIGSSIVYFRAGFRF